MDGRIVVGAVLALYLLRTVELKAGVVLDLSPEMRAALDTVEAVHVRIAGRGAIITSARDGKHKDGSLHYRGDAVDVRTRDLAPAVRARLASALANDLGPGFDVVLEPDHIHIEYDPR